jgi:hypothetical protein
LKNLLFRKNSSNGFPQHPKTVFSKQTSISPRDTPGYQNRPSTSTKSTKSVTTKSPSHLTCTDNRVHVDPGTRADPEKKALFGAAKEVIDLTKHIGTEIVGLQLTDLNNKQKDELALLIAERSVVFFRDQDINPRQQLEFTSYFGEIEAHPRGPQVPGLPGVTVIWPDYNNVAFGRNAHFRKTGVRVVGIRI